MTSLWHHYDIITPLEDARAMVGPWYGHGRAMECCGYPQQFDAPLCSDNPSRYNSACAFPSVFRQFFAIKTCLILGNQYNSEVFDDFDAAVALAVHLLFCLFTHLRPLFAFEGCKQDTVIDTTISARREGSTAKNLGEFGARLFAKGLNLAVSGVICLIYPDMIWYAYNFHI